MFNSLLVKPIAANVDNWDSYRSPLLTEGGAVADGVDGATGGAVGNWTTGSLVSLTGAEDDDEEEQKEKYWKEKYLIFS